MCAGEWGKGVLQGLCHWDFTKLPGAGQSWVGIPAWPSLSARPSASHVSPPNLGFPTRKMGTTLPASPGGVRCSANSGLAWGTAQGLCARGHIRGRGKGGGGRPQEPGSQQPASAPGGGARSGRRLELRRWRLGASSPARPPPPADSHPRFPPAASPLEDGNRRAARERDAGVAQERGREPQGQTGGGAGQAARRGA